MKRTKAPEQRVAADQMSDHEQVMEALLLIAGNLKSLHDKVDALTKARDKKRK